MKRLFFLFFLILFYPLIISAHQPRIVEGDEPVEIKNPDVSQAFYGNLNGQPQIFRINLSENQEIYIGILVPDIPDAKKDIYVEITSSGIDNYVYYFLDGSIFDWKPYYEEFAGDDYFKGPETRIAFEKGEYNIRVFSFSGGGKYVLAVGDKEEFPLKEALKSLIILPKLKMGFFEKPFYLVFWNKLGFRYVLPSVIALLAIIAIIIFAVIRNKRRKSEEPWILK